MIMLDFGKITIPYVMEIVSNLGVNCIIGWRFMLLLGAGTEPSLAHGSYASITYYKACIPDTSSTEVLEMPRICIMSSKEKPVRLGKLYLSKEECEMAVKGRDETKSNLHSRTFNSEIKRQVKEHKEGSKNKAWKYQIMNTLEVEKLFKKRVMLGRVPESAENREVSNHGNGGASARSGSQHRSSVQCKRWD